MTDTPVALRIGPYSRLVRPRRAASLLGLAALLVMAIAMSLAVGSAGMPLERVVAALLGVGDDMDRLIVMEFRLPRALQAIEAGACLAVAGLLLQRSTRNPLASPDVLGVVDGAALGVVLFLVLFSGADDALTVSIHWQPVAATFGGVAFLALLFALAREQAGQPIRLLLFGVALAALAKAATTLFLILGPIQRASQVFHWLAGSVHTATWEEVAIVAAMAAPLLLLAGAMARRLDLLDLDQATSRSFGLRTMLIQSAAILLAAALTAVAVSFVGGIGFVGLIAPHLVRLLVGRGGGGGLLGAAMAGALMVVTADLAVRLLFAPLEVPTGAATAVVGAPYLLYLLTRRTHADG